MIKINNPLRFILLSSSLLAVFYLSSVYYLGIHQVAITYNKKTGNTMLIKKAGFHIAPPWILASRIDTRPRKYCIPSIAKTATCKLASFRPEEYRSFVYQQGFRYYWWANRISVNFGNNQEYRGMNNILLGYVFSEKEFPFLEIYRKQSE
jgi:hypothetical protein